MPRFARFDSSIKTRPSPVLGWLDTDLVHYPSPPSEADLLEVTDAQWAGRMEGLWAVQTGILVAYTPPPPPPLTPAQQAGVALNQPVTVQCETHPELDAAYANSAAIRQAMTGVVAQINAGLGLPGGGQTFNWPDADGMGRAWPATEFVAFATAVAHFAYACTQTAGGFDDTVPSSVLVVDPAAAIAARRNL
jgi:hypothetical protein